MDDVLELNTRRKIYELVVRNPGLHLSKIAELLGMRTSLAEYHLHYLEKNQIIVPVKESGYTRYYIKGEIGREDKKMLSLLRQDIPLIIVLFLLKSDISQHKEILKNLDIAPSTLSYHLKKLVNHNIISVQTYGDDKGYCVVNKKDIIRILLQYKPYSSIDSFNDIWLDLKIE